MEAISTLLYFLITIGILVSFHEFGHYSAARMCGVKVLRFAVGFGKPLLTLKSKSGTEWVIAAIPLGGYVKLLDGRDSEQQIPAEEQAVAFDTQPLWQRSLIVAAGPLANFLLAIVLLAFIYINGVPQLPAQIQAPAEQTLAAQLDMEKGDEILAWKTAGEDQFIPIVSWNDLRWRLLDAITAERGFSLELEAESGKRHIVEFKGDALPRLSPGTDPFARLGILPIPGKDAEGKSTWFELQLGLIDSLVYASERVWLITKVSTRMMIGLITGETSLKQLSGPISIADMAGKSAQFGWQSFVSFLALLSISIGLLNLIPLPMLDGGQLLYDAWELVSGKRLSSQLQAVFQRFGFILIIALTLFAVFNDLQRLFLSS
jgi:regulator of sigma E protease